MEFLTLVLVIIILCLLINYKNGFSKKLDILQQQMTNLQQQLKDVINTSKPVKEDQPLVKPVIDSTAPQTASKPTTPDIPPIPKANPAPAEIPIAAFTSLEPKPVTAIPPPVKPKPPQPSFFERHPDLEKFIGENLVSKIGIAILVLAIGFFVKYAIDNDWIGPVGRVGIGILCGSILIGIAHKLRNNYKAFSSVLVGGGIAVFYFTITLAYHQFHLFSQTVSFIILIIITSFAVILSLLYNRQELAIIALIGGLASPFMVSSGQANFVALFIYLVILNGGLLIIAYNKSWRILNISAFALTVLVYAAVLFAMPKTSYGTGLLFATILYLLFLAINVANNIKENKTFIAADFSILLVNTALYFSAGMFLLYQINQRQLQGVFAASLAAVNLIISYLLFKSKKADTNILYLLIGITLTLVSLTAPIQLHGHYITLFWAAEAVMLYWLFQKSGIRLMRLSSLILWSAMLISLLMDWLSVYSVTAKIPVIANKGFITTIVAAISSWLLFTLKSKDQQPSWKIEVPTPVFKFAALILLFLSGYLETDHQFYTRYPYTPVNINYLMLYAPAFVLILTATLRRRGNNLINQKWQLAILSLTLLVYLLNYNRYNSLQFHILVLKEIPAVHFLGHWASAICIAILLYQIVRLCKNNLPAKQLKIAGWLLSGVVLLFLSMEIYFVNNSLFFKNEESLYTLRANFIRTGLPLIWGIVSFALMWLGMRYKDRNLRVISLTFFTVTLVKLFTYDIRNISPGGKIAAFFSLGVLLLIISFMYQKVKKIITEDEKPSE